MNIANPEKVAWMFRRVIKTPDVEKLTRQRKRAALRSRSIAEMHRQYGGEPRRVRRAMGIALSKRRYQDGWPA